ncbi:MAG: cyanophycin synthetase, partial [Desulfoferrobacter sp.]
TSEIKAEFVTPRGNIKVRSSLLGRLNLYNMLAAATAALALGVSPEAVSAGLEAVKFVDGRLQRVPIPPQFNFEVVVDYAHTPDAMEKSLDCLKEMTSGRLLVVFGCGGDRDRGKRPIMGAIAARIGDLVILTSDNPRSEVPAKIIQDIEPGVRSIGLKRIDSREPAPTDKGYIIEEDRKTAIALALSWAAPGDVIFIGGKGHETYQIIGDRVASFDDRTVVQEYFASSILSASGAKRK